MSDHAVNDHGGHGEVDAADLGAIDLRAWAAGLVGAFIGLITVAVIAAAAAAARGA
ncbi:MAG: hypothetical protein ACKN9R_04625 [Candidatus Limnocylindrus sp.]|jgi:hypothetical protein